MRRQRNNVAGMAYEQRRLVSRLLKDGATFAEVNAAVRRQWPDAPKLHNSSLAAWLKSPEYLRYSAARENDKDETDQVRAMAEALNDGKGPESMADLTVMEVVRELWRQTKGGQITDLADLANVTKALAPLLRAQIARDLADSRRREADLARSLDLFKAAHEDETTALRAEVARLIGMLKAAGIDPDAAAAKAGDGLSPATLRQIEEKAKLL